MKNANKLTPTQKLNLNRVRVHWDVDGRLKTDNSDPLVCGVPTARL